MQHIFFSHFNYIAIKKILMKLTIVEIDEKFTMIYFGGPGPLAQALLPFSE